MARSMVTLFITAFVLGLVFNATPGPVFAETVRQGVGGFRSALAGAVRLARRRRTLGSGRPCWGGPVAAIGLASRADQHRECWLSVVKSRRIRPELARWNRPSAGLALGSPAIQSP